MLTLHMLGEENYTTLTLSHLRQSRTGSKGNTMLGRDVRPGGERDVRPGGEREGHETRGREGGT